MATNPKHDSDSQVLQEEQSPGVKPLFYLVKVQGVPALRLTLGKPLPLKTTTFGLQIVPFAEVTPESLDVSQNYSLSEIAVVLGVSPSTIKREIRDGNLKVTEVRGRRVVLYEDAVAYLQGHKKGA